MADNPESPWQKAVREMLSTGPAPTSDTPPPRRVNMRVDVLNNLVDEMDRLRRRIEELEEEVRGYRREVDA